MIRRRRLALVAAIVALAASAVAATPAEAANVTISGQVTVGGVGRSGFSVSATTGNGSSDTTDATGQWSLTLPAGTTTIFVRAGAIGPDLPRTTRLTFDLSVQAGQTVDVGFPAAVDATVHVVDADGDPVVGATVTDQRSSIVGVTHPGTFSGFLSQAEATTDANGDAQFVDFPGLADLTVDHRGAWIPRRTVVVDDADVQAGATIEAELEALVTVSGHVTSGGTGAAGVSVWTTRTADPSAGRGLDETDASGAFELSTLPGASRLTVSGRPTGSPAVQLESDVEVTEGAVFDIELPEPVTMTATVLDTRGDPVHGAVNLDMSEITADFVMPGSDVEIEVGDQVFTGEPPGPVTVHAVAGTATLHGVGFLTLTPFRNREVTVEGVEVVQDGHVDLPVPAVPLAPESVQMRATGPGTAQVTWEPPADTGPMPVTSYEILIGDPGWYERAAPEPSIPPPPLTASYGPGVRSAVLHLGNGHPTELRLRAHTQVGPGAWAFGSVTPRLRHRVDVVSGDVGQNDYSAGDLAQMVQTSVRRGHPSRFRHTVENDGSTRERMLVVDRSNAAGLDVRWFDGNRNVTADVRAGRYRTPLLSAGQDHDLVAVASVRPGVRRGAFFIVRLQSSPACRPAQHDLVSHWITVT